MSDLSTDVRSRLQSMHHEDFEHFVADLWGRQGWTARRTPQSGDRSVDVVAELDQGGFTTRAAIQAKRNSEGNKVESPVVRKVFSAKHRDDDTDVAIVVTTSSFTGPAREEAADSNVKLIDGSDLLGLIDELDAHDLVDEYAPVQDPEPEPSGMPDALLDDDDEGEGKSESSSPDLEFGTDDRTIGLTVVFIFSAIIGYVASEGGSPEVAVIFLIVMLLTGSQALAQIWEDFEEVLEYLSNQ